MSIDIAFYQRVWKQKINQDYLLIYLLIINKECTLSQKSYYRKDLGVINIYRDFCYTKYHECYTLVA